MCSSKRQDTRAAARAAGQYQSAGCSETRQCDVQQQRARAAAECRNGRRCVQQQRKSVTKADRLHQKRADCIKRGQIARFCDRVSPGRTKPSAFRPSHPIPLKTLNFPGARIFLKFENEFPFLRIFSNMRIYSHFQETETVD
jgi:hypothetical protein